MPMHVHLVFLKTSLLTQISTLCSPPDPERARWKTLTKCTLRAVIIMNTWSLGEIRQAAKIHCLTNEQQNLAVDTLKIFGPIPRICIDFVQDRGQPLNHEIRSQAMVMGLTYPSLRRLVLHGGALDLDEVLHTVFLTRRYEVDNLARAYLEPRSANVKIQPIS